MIKKFKNYIQLKLIRFLGIDKLDMLINMLDSDQRKMSVSIDIAYSQLSNHDKRISSLYQTISNVVSVGSDIEYSRHGQSWAVVCIEGNYNVVKFVDLRGRNAREILGFLKQFEASRYVHDAPMGSVPKNMFIDWF